MDKPLNAAAVLAALQRIDLRRWGAKATIVMYVAELTAARDPIDYARGGRGYVHEHTGLAESAIQKITRALVRDRVLEVQPGRGSRGHGYRIQPNVRLWQRVPWRVDAGAAAYSVELANGELRYVAQPRLADHSIGGQQIRITDHSIGGQQRTGCRPLHERSASGRSLTSQEVVSNGIGTDHSIGGQQIRPDREPSPYSFIDDEDEETKQLIDAIQKATGSPVWGSLIRRVALVLRAGLPLGDALAHVAAAGSKWTPPQLVGQLEARAQGAPPISSPEPVETAPPAVYADWGDRSRWALPEVDLTRPPPALSGLLARANGCQNGHRAEEE
jgi:hypothetical protein